MISIISYLRWGIYAAVHIFFLILCYITNPFVVLFADKYGNLPYYFRYWQTYDNCLDIDWMIDEGIVPKLFRYDFHKHYIYHPEEKTLLHVSPGYVELIDDNFTLWERIQRYVCRLLWLYRNTAYGFSYYLLGAYINMCTLQIRNMYRNGLDDETYMGYTDEGKYWCYYLTKHYTKKRYIRLYLGWKFKFKEPQTGFMYCQFAFCISPFRKIKE